MFGPFQSLNGLYTGSVARESWLEKRFDVILSLIYAREPPSASGLCFWQTFSHLLEACLQMSEHGFSLSCGLCHATEIAQKYI